jgi:REP element-mobilizing transposase RayT
MTIARQKLINLSQTHHYHCTNKCVQGLFLCGLDRNTGVDYSYRKGWILDLLKYITQYFSIQLCAYAIMSNHYHLVLYVNEPQALAWSDEEVLTRWSKVHPTKAKAIKTLMDQGVMDEKLRESIHQIRLKLMSISWLMHWVNQKIAMQFNKESKTKGHFWQSRFNSQALLDDGALLTAMAYVDLNPIRANIAATPEESEFTSIYERIKAIKEYQAHQVNGSVLSSCERAPQPQGLMPFYTERLAKETPDTQIIDFPLSQYLELVDHTGRMIREDKKGHIPSNLTNILTRLDLDSDGWTEMVNNIESLFSYAVGSPSHITEFGKANMRRAPNGITVAKNCYLVSVA